MSVMEKRRKPRERVVTAVHSSSEVNQWMHVPGEVIEIRGHRDGSWTVHYPREGWYPSSPREQHPFDETFYKPTSLEDANEWAHKLAEGREVKVVPYTGPGRRKKNVED